MREEDRKWVIGIVDEGRKSQYWAILRGQMEEWLADENRILDSFKALGIRTADDREKYNRAVDRKRYLMRMLGVNEAIIEHNQSMMDKLKKKTVAVFSAAESFLTDLLR